MARVGRGLAVAALDVGAVEYYTDARIIALYGLTDPATMEQRRHRFSSRRHREASAATNCICRPRRRLVVSQVSPAEVKL